MVTEVVILIILILLSGFFSGAEVALLSINVVRVRMLRKQKRKGAESLHRLKSNPRKMIITILIGNNVVNIVAASMSTYIAALHFGSLGVGIATGLLTLIILVVGEITPKTFAQQYATEIAPLIARPIELMQKFLSPLVYVLDKQTSFLENLVKVKKIESISEAEIKEMIAFGVENKVVHSKERYIMNRALDFADTTARAIMIPASKAFLLKKDMTIQSVVNKIINKGFSRIPIYDGLKSNIVGIVLVKDILFEINNKHGGKTLDHVLVKPFFVSDTILIHNLLQQFKHRFTHIALVRDHAKRFVGIVTLEDLLEELVGEIEDESDVHT